MVSTVVIALSWLMLVVAVWRACVLLPGRAQLIGMIEHERSYLPGSQTLEILEQNVRSVFVLTSAKLEHWHECAREDLAYTKARWQRIEDEFQGLYHECIALAQAGDVIQRYNREFVDPEWLRDLAVLRDILNHVQRRKEGLSESERIMFRAALMLTELADAIIPMHKLALSAKTIDCQCAIIAKALPDVAARLRTRLHILDEEVALFDLDDAHFAEVMAEYRDIERECATLFWIVSDLLERRALLAIKLHEVRFDSVALVTASNQLAVASRNGQHVALCDLAEQLQTHVGMANVALDCTESIIGAPSQQDFEHLFNKRRIA